MVIAMLGLVCYNHDLDWLVMRGDEGVLKTAVEVDAIGVEEQPKLVIIMLIVYVYVFVFVL